jgi:hypothetical protein
MRYNFVRWKKKSLLEESNNLHTLKRRSRKARDEDNSKDWMTGRMLFSYLV